MWVDVEPYTVSPWTRSHPNNAAVIRGVVAGYQRADYPEWRTAGQPSTAY